ncbi:hypothetical protein GCM10011368_00280 [Hyunsoonleella pacifica]|nr:hypothetical protein GCM10011368_00280 [Hyunsoonleella pacifica]
MPSIHFKRWTSQLKGAGYDVYWFDILNGGYIEELDWVEQHTDWKYKIGNFKGRFFVKKYFPALHKLLENNQEKEFEKLLEKVKPDVVQSFVLYKCAVPIYNVMLKHNTIKWIYSSWGSDLYFFKNLPKYREDIIKVLGKVNYLFTDNERDSRIARNLGFSNKFLGAFPGGGGFHIDKIQSYILPLYERNTILIKGYQGRSGRAIEVLKAIRKNIDVLMPYELVVFGADPEVESFIKNDVDLKELDISVHSKRKLLTHIQVLKLMGKSLIYIGNSNSDGMPNTLLEAIIMGVFPIQSNPGGVTEEVINNGKNGMLIHNYDDVDEISTTIVKVLKNKKMLCQAHEYNLKLQVKLEYNVIKENVLKAYNYVEKELKTLVS